MLRKYVPVFFASAILSFAFAACGGNEDLVEPCADCPSGGGAVECHSGWGSSQTICAPDQTLAAIQCVEGGGSWTPIALCPLEPGETGNDPGNDAWRPGRDITFDPDTNEFVIDQLAFEELKLDPAPLFGDSSQLRELESGYFEVAVAGELSDALGWQVGDVLVSVDDYDLSGLAAFAAAFTDLADNTSFELAVQRERGEVLLRYRIE